MLEENVITGKVYVLGDNIDTDIIIPAQYLSLVPTIPEEYEKLGSYALSGLPDDAIPFVEKGKTKSEYSILIAGSNFGCGSSREHAPLSLSAAGVKVVVAVSFARIFFRNCIATGALYPCQSLERLCNKFTTGEEATVNLTNNIIINSKGEEFKFMPLGVALDVIKMGGLFKYAIVSGMIKSHKVQKKKITRV